MTGQPEGRKAPETGSWRTVRRYTWVWIVVGVLMLAVAAFFLMQGLSSEPFVLLEGEEELLVLIRNDEEGVYRAQYAGRKPVDIESLQVMLAGQVLHVDVKEVALIREGQEVILKGDGTLPPGTQFNLKQDEAFDVRVTFLGQSIGGNYMYGFRIDYGDGGKTKAYELVLDFDYAIIVK